MHCISQQQKSNILSCSAVEIDISTLYLHEISQFWQSKKKYLALKDLEKVLTEKNVAEKFSVPQNTLTYWIKHKENIASKYESVKFRAKRQKLSVGKHDSADKVVYKWFMNTR